MTTFSIQVPCTSAALPGLMQSLLASAPLEHLDAVTRHHVQLIVEEMVVNVIDHGELHAHDHIKLQLRREQDALLIELRDSGKAFDPTQPREAATDAELDDKPIGGLGVHLVQTLSDDIGYQRLQGENHTVIRLRVERP